MMRFCIFAWLVLFGVAPAGASEADGGRKLAPALQPFVKEGTIPGAVVLVASAQGVLAEEALGVSDLKTGAAMRKDAMFWIASMTKPMTAMGVMMLVEEGKLGLEDPVERILPEFRGQWLAEEVTRDRAVLRRPKRAVTVKDLMTHTSGLTGKSPLDPVELDTLTLREAVISYALTPLQFEPGSKWSYCNPGINTLGRIIEVVSGQPYAEFMQERLFGPLGMKDTTFWPTEEQAGRLVTSYKPNAEKTGLEQTGLTFLSSPVTNRKRMPLPAGGLFSCAGDLARIYRMVLNGGELDGRRYLKKETLDLMTRNHTGDLKVSFSEGMHMGLGFHVVNRPTGVTEALSPGSYGHGGAYGTQAWMDPARGLAIVLLIQRAGLPNSDQSEMRRALQRAAVEVFGK